MRSEKKNNSTALALTCIAIGLVVAFVSLQLNSAFPIIIGITIAIYGLLELLNSYAKTHPSMGKPSSMYAPITDEEYGPEYAAMKRAEKKANAEAKAEENGDPDTARFCPYCGTPADADFMFCKKCGKKLPE